jgi:hypothetical protein
MSSAADNIAARLKALKPQGPGFLPAEWGTQLIDLIIAQLLRGVINGTLRTTNGFTVVCGGNAVAAVLPPAFLNVYQIDATHIGVTPGTVTFNNTVSFPGCSSAGSGDTGPQEITAAQSAWLQVNYTTDGIASATGIDSLALSIVDTGTSPGTNDYTKFYLLLADVPWDSMASAIQAPITPYCYVRNNVSLMVCGDNSTPYPAP